MENAIYALWLTLLECVMQEYADESKEIPRPEHWGGYLVRPKSIEFWHGRPSRLHDRLKYSLQDGKWSRQRLSP